MAKELCFLTAIGKDRKGIIARISTELYYAGINIEEVDMNVMEGYFVMTMFIDVSDSPISIKRLREQMKDVEKEMNLKIQIQHENVFKPTEKVFMRSKGALAKKRKA